VIGVVTTCFERGLWYNTRAFLHYLGVDNVKYFSHNSTRPASPGDFPMSDITYPAAAPPRPVQTVRWIRQNKIKELLTFEGSHLPVSALRPEVEYMADFVDWEIVQHQHAKNLKLYDEILFPTPKTAELFRDMGNIQIVADVDWAYDVEPGGPRDNSVVQIYHNRGWGGLHERKNTELAIKAFLKKWRNSKNVRLVITTQTQVPPEWTEGADNILVEVGTISRDRVLGFYRASHIFLYPTKREGLGLGLYEAQRAGCVVITTDDPPMNEISREFIHIPVANRRAVVNSFVPLSIVNIDDTVSAIEEGICRVQNTNSG